MTLRRTETSTPPVPSFASLRASMRLLAPSDARALLLLSIGALERQWDALTDYADVRFVASTMRRVQQHVPKLAATIAATAETEARRARIAALVRTAQDRRPTHGG